MRQEDFLLSFQEALTGSVGEDVIRENLMYYQKYIRKQVELGKSEDEVLASLGNPRLLAKTIIESNKFVEESAKEAEHDSWRQDYSDRYRWRNQSAETEDKGTGQDKKYKVFQLPSWLTGILCVIVMALLIGLAFCVVSYLAPILIAIAIAVLAYRVVRKMFRGY